MTCEVCGEAGHSGNDCPETREEASYLNNAYRPEQGGGNNWNNQSRPPFQGNSNYNSGNSNSPSLKDLVLGQAKINENLTKKMNYNDKILESLNNKVEGLSSAVKSQLSFNKMIETQLAQIAAKIPINADTRKIPGQPETSPESVNMVFSKD